MVRNPSEILMGDGGHIVPPEDDERHGDVLPFTDWEGNDSSGAAVSEPEVALEGMGKKMIDELAEFGLTQQEMGDRGGYAYALFLRGQDLEQVRDALSKSQVSKPAREAGAYDNKYKRRKNDQ